MTTRFAVIGAGHLGRIHARLLAQHPSAHLVAVVDPDPTARYEVAAAWNATPLADLEEVAGTVDAAVVAAPSSEHARLGKWLLDSGIHVFMEKPFAVNTAEADGLLRTARQCRRILQVGHVERFNPAWKAAFPHLPKVPTCIQANRLSSYSFRSLDVGVVLDLMIHDLDLALQLVEADVKRVTAVGRSLLGAHEDFAHAFLEFQNGTIASFTASRVSPVPTRRWSISSDGVLATIDFSTREAELIRVPDRSRSGAWQTSAGHNSARAQFQATFFEELLPLEKLHVSDTNAIQEELDEFLAAIEGRRSPQVTAQVGRDAVAIADLVLQSIQKNQVAMGPVQDLPHVLALHPARARLYGLDSMHPSAKRAG
jgi:predicted dehydrogenase